MNSRRVFLSSLLAIAIVPAMSGSSAEPAAAPECTAGLCDDFDSYPAGGPPQGIWKVDTRNGGTVTVDTVHAFSPPNAVHVVSPGSQSYERAFMSIEGEPLLPLPGNEIFGRMMVFATEVPAGEVHWTIVQADGPVPAMNIPWAAYRYGGQLIPKRWMANYDTMGPPSDCFQHSQTSIPQNRWTCVEWQFNGPRNELNFWLDGQALGDLTVIQRGEGCVAQGTQGNWFAPTFSALRLGWEHYQQAPGELWIDDVSIGAERIGCPSPLD
jgi:hypothetical protein